MTRKPTGSGPADAPPPDRAAAWPDHPTAGRPGRAAVGDAAAGDDRIAKVMARAGLCSRRDAEDWIAAGRVAINGAVIASPAVNVSARDRVTVDGKPLPRRERTRLFRYHKPVGLITTDADPQGRPTVFDALPANLPRVMSVGRLDVGTEGLLLLTNDGGLARVLELPQTQWLRLYRVRAHGRVSQEALDRLRDGIAVDGVHYGPIEATLERERGANVWLSFAIREGKNREVRNVLAHLGLQVNRLIRVAYGPFRLDDLAEGAVVEVETEDLRAQLGAEILARAECDLKSPVNLRRDAPDLATRRDDARAERGDRRGRRDDRAPRGDGRGPPRSRSTVDEDEDKPPGRPRRGHAWRQDDAPLRRTYRGSRRDDLKMADATDRPDKRAGLLTDRKGRRILVERFGTKPPEPAPIEKPMRPPRRPPRDRAAGPRPSRPKFSEARERDAAEPRRPGSRDAADPRRQGARDDRAASSGPRPPRGKFSGRSSGPRILGAPGEPPQRFTPRPPRGGFAEARDADRPPRGPHKSGPRKPGPRDERAKPFGPRPAGSRGDTPGAGRPPRSSGPRPSDGRPSRPGSRPPRSPGSRPSGSPRPPRSSGPRPPRAR